MEHTTSCKLFAMSDLAEWFKNRKTGGDIRARQEDDLQNGEFYIFLTKHEKPIREIRAPTGLLEYPLHPNGTICWNKIVSFGEVSRQLGWELLKPYRSG